MSLKQIVFVGAPSTGKSTIARALAEKYITEWVPEYGRHYWQEYQIDRRLTQEQLVEIAIGQRAWEEDAAQKATNYLFIDTEAIVTRQYAFDYYGHSSPELDYYADLSKDRYDHFFLCATDIPYEDDWARSGEVHRVEFQQRLIEDLTSRQINFTELHHSHELRMANVEKVLEELFQS